MQAIRGYIDEHRDEMIADLKAFVKRETPSEDKGLLNAFADYPAEYGYCTVSEPWGPGLTLTAGFSEHDPHRMKHICGLNYGLL